jgi:DNA-binding winged helix-turn-helix (wHTH) protein
VADLPSGPRTKNNVRQLVTRCRKQLKKDFRDIHGVEPDEHLLIQSRQGHGYRLDPTIEIVDSD